jgi:hypothetical protein
LSKSKAVHVERAEAQILADVETQRAALADAQREIGELQLRRRETLLSAAIDDVHEIDTAIDRAATKVDMAQARINAFEEEFERLRAAERDAQTAADLARAQRLAEEARQLIVGVYAEAARTIAETLARLETIQSEVSTLTRLPSGAVLQIEAFRGFCATLGASVELPGVTTEDANFWPTRPRRQLPNEIYARN